MRNYISAYWSRFSESSLCELVELVGDMIPLPEIDTSKRDRIFNSWRTFWLFLGQVLSPLQSCREALIKACSWLLVAGKEIISTNTSAYCQARARLEQGYLDKIFRETVRQNQDQLKSKDLWFGRHVKVVDGSSASMPDTPQNQKLYPQPSGQAEGCGFPVIKFVVSFSLATGVLLDYGKSRLNVHDKILWQKIWNSYQEGDVVLGDRGFCGFADFWLLSKKKIDSVMRLHQARKKIRIIKEFDKNDYIVEWEKGKLGEKPEWVTAELWQQMPGKMMVRYVVRNIDIPGFRTEKIILATTLLDPTAYPADAIAELYRRRWMVELFLRDIKTTMRMDVLRCQTPELIQKELTVFFIAYNLIRSLIWQAASKKGIDPYRISFTAAVAFIRQWVVILTAIKNNKQKKKFINTLFELLAKQIIPPGKKYRREPRAIKRRRRNSYQLLTKPRNLFTEIPHREGYKKI